MHFVKHLSTSIMNFNNTTIFKGGRGESPAPLNETLIVLLAFPLISLKIKKAYLSMRCSVRSSCQVKLSGQVMCEVVRGVTEVMYIYIYIYTGDLAFICHCA